MPEDQNEIMIEIRRRFEKAYDAISSEYQDMIEDLNFLQGEQWSKDLESDRNADGRPCLVVNKLASFHDQICGDIRMNSPSIKVKPVDSDADPETAEMLTGLIRNIVDNRIFPRMEEGRL